MASGTLGNGTERASSGGSRLIGYFANNHVTANVLMLLLVGIGLYSANQLPKEQFPAFDPGTITVTVPYLGAAPVEIEEDVNRRIEESLGGIVGVERVRSSAAEGVGVVTVELETFADPLDVLDNVRTAVDRLENFPPANAEQPEIVRSEPVRKVAVLAVSSSNLDEDGLRRDAEALRDALLALPTVSFVSLVGARGREIQIELSEEALRRHGLTIGEVVNLVRHPRSIEPAASCAPNRAMSSSAPLPNTPKRKSSRTSCSSPPPMVRWLGCGM